jgi:hypothetical protein
MRSKCCLCIDPIISEPIFVSLSVYIMALMPISFGCLKNISHQCGCLYVYPSSLLGNGLLKHFFVFFVLNPIFICKL